ncbi:MAG: hypothetical protein QOD71_1598 [Thermoleophilaceae bacterium]|nr:hypothetical protein [Thermoleophilaceae bacterium]
MQQDETTTPAVVEATPAPAKQRRAKIAAAVVGICLLAMGSSFAASMAMGSVMGGDHGPPGGGSSSMQSSCPDGPPAGMGPS